MRRMISFRFSLAAVLAVCCVSGAAAQQQPNNCTGVDFDAKRPLVVSTVTARPRSYFVKSAWEDASCPADKESCQRKAYLVPGDLVLTGVTLGSYTCVAYQSPRDRKQDWTNGWMPSAALAPVAAMASPQLSDWIGTWTHAGGEIAIERGKNGKLTIEGEQTYPAAQNVHTGVISAAAKPSDTMLAFADDGSLPFGKAGEGSCQVRMQRIGALLLVEDNGGCGGSMVTFTGLYRRK
jgi:hypothetical protein